MAQEESAKREDSTVSAANHVAPANGQQNGSKDVPNTFTSVCVCGCVCLY